MTNQKNKDLATQDIIWKLQDLYNSLKDPAIANDITQCEADAKKINEKFAGKVATLNDNDLLELVVCLENLEILLGKISTFAYLNFATQTKNTDAGAFLQKIRETLSRISKETVFFELEWNKVDPDKAASLTASPALKKYRHYLESLRRYAPHQLSHTEEKLLIEKAPVGRSSWTGLFDKVFGHLKFGEEQRTEEEVLSDLYDKTREVRKKAAADLTNGFQSQLHILTHIFNTILADKMIDDRLRKYDSWVSTMNLYNELENKTVEVLVDCVTSRYDISQRYYRLKKQLLGLPELYDYDRYAPIPHLPDTLIPWGECKKMVLDAFRAFSSKKGEIASFFFDRRWIHAPILEGKRSGAFAHPCVPEAHPYVMVNYTGNLRDVSTVAHELGHGVHQYLAAENGYYNSDTPLVLAETASVFGELLVFNNQLEKIEHDLERKAFICQKLESIFATVFRQVSMNRFEHLIHNGRREKGELSSEEMSGYWLQTQKAMFEDSVTLTDNYGIWWSYIPHFLSSPGYVYSYAFGELLVLALYKIYLQDRKAFVPKYLDLLKAGGSQSPYELLKPFGVDIDDPNFWMGGLDIIDDMLKMVE